MGELSTQKLYRLVKDEDYEGAIKMLDEDPFVLSRIGYDSMSCAGGWGMPMYAHVATFLDAGHEVSGHSNKYRDAAGMRAVAEKVFEKAPTVFYQFSEQNLLSLKCNYAMRAGWVDILHECTAGGLDRDWMKDLVRDIKDLPKVVADYLDGQPLPELQIAKVEDVQQKVGDANEDDDDTCCICLDAHCDAIFSPCAHNTFCFACSRDLKTCPLCRTEGYAKLRQPV